MSVSAIKSFSEQAKSDGELGEKLSACQKVGEMIKLARGSGFEFGEDDLYPPNEPQFTEDQLSERLVKALLRV